MTALLAAAAVTTAHAGTAIHDAENDAFTATLKCHDANGELYMLNFSRDRISFTSYSDETIRFLRYECCSGPYSPHYWGGGEQPRIDSCWHDWSDNPARTIHGFHHSGTSARLFNRYLDLHLGILHQRD